MLRYTTIIVSVSILLVLLTPSQGQVSPAPCGFGNCCASYNGYECCSNCPPGRSGSCGVNGSGRPWCECRGGEPGPLMKQIFDTNMSRNVGCGGGRNQCSQKSSKNICSTNCDYQAAYCGINGSNEAWCECRPN